MDFLEAMKALVEGKRVRRLFWEQNEYIMIDEYGNIVCQNGKPYAIDYLSDNWELFQ